MTALRKIAALPERLFVALLVAALAAPISLLGYVGWQSRQDALADAAESTRQAVDMLHEHALKVFETHDLILHQIDRSLLGSRWEEIERDARLRSTLQAFTARSGPVKTIWLTDATGRVRASSEGASNPPNAADREYFKAQRDSDPGTFVSAPFVGRTTGASVFAMSRRRTGPTSDFDGTVHATVDRGYFESFWKSVAERAGLDTSIALIRSDGVVLARFPDVTGHGARPATVPAIARLSPDIKSGTVPRIRGVDGEDRIASYRRLTGLPVVVTYSVKRDAVLAAWLAHVAPEAMLALTALAGLAALSATALRLARRRARAEMEARQTQLNLLGILETTTDSVFMLDRDWRFVYVNRRAEAAMARQNLLGSNVWDIFPQAVGNRFWHAYRRTMEDRETVDVEGFLKPFGRWYEARSHPLNDGIAVFFRDITDRKVAEQELRRSQEHLLRAQRAAAVGTWEWNAATDETRWSEETYRLFGVSPDSFVPKRDAVLGLLVEEERVRAREIGDLIQQGKFPTAEQFALDHRVALPDGSIRVLRRAGSALLDEAGRPIGVVGTIQDVTAEAAAEERLRHSEERFRVAVRVANCAVWEWNVTTGCVDYAGLKDGRLGYEASQVEPTFAWWAERIHRDDRERVLEHVHRAIGQREGFWEGEYRFRNGDGSFGYVIDRAYTQFDATGEPVRMIGAMFDITAQKAIEEELRRTATHLARAQQIAGIGSWEYDRRAGTLRWSDEVYRLGGFDPGAVTPTPDLVLSMLHPDDRAAVERSVQQTIASGQSSSGECRILRPDGTTRIAMRQTEPLRDHAGEVIGVLGTIQDVTEARAAEQKRRELEALLLQAQKMEALGTLAGGIAHDLNNTLTPILMLTGMVARELPADSRARKDLAVVEQAGQRARDLVRQIVAFGRKQETDKKRLDLADTLRSSMSMLRAMLLSNIVLTLEEACVPPVLADPTQIHQILVNLTSNAAHAIGAAYGRITIGLEHRPEQGCVCIHVADTGTGMAKTVLDRAFEPYFTTKPVDQGSGLGLAVVHGIVARHGGRIAVESAPGSGTRVSIELPVAAEAGGAGELVAPEELPAAAGA